MRPFRTVRGAPTALATACLLCIASTPSAQGQGARPDDSVQAVHADWPQWRGPSRDGISPEGSGHPAGWPPARLWSTNVGVGCTSPILAAGRLYVMGWSGSGRPRGPEMGTDTLYCFDAASGHGLWKRTCPARYQGRLRTGDTGAYGGPSATPTLDTGSGLLYSLGVDGDLRCWDTKADGRPVWSLNLYDEYKVPQRPDSGGGVRDYGFTSGPLLCGRDVVVEVGDEEGTVMAFEPRTGRRHWASQYGKPAGHTGGVVPCRVLGRDCLAVLALHDLVVMRADPGGEGKTVATFRWQTEFGCNIPTPAVSGSRIVVTSAYNRHRTALLEVGSSGIRELWHSPRHALVSSPLIYRGQVFLINGALVCLSLGTGEERWKGGSFGHGSCLATADNRLIVFGNGRLALVEAQPASGQYTELARIEKVVPGTYYPQVALSGGVLACKDREGNLACFSVRK